MKLAIANKKIISQCKLPLLSTTPSIIILKKTTKTTKVSVKTKSPNKVFCCALGNIKMICLLKNFG